MPTPSFRDAPLGAGRITTIGRMIPGSLRFAARPNDKGDGFFASLALASNRRHCEGHLRRSNQHVIPGCAPCLGAGPESITTIGSMDSGSLRFAARPGMTKEMDSSLRSHSRPTAVIARGTCDEAIQHVIPGCAPCLGAGPESITTIGIWIPGSLRFAARPGMTASSLKSPPVHRAIHCARRRGPGNVSPVAARPPRCLRSRRARNGPP